MWLPCQTQHHQGRGQDLKGQDKDRIILTSDKVLAMVVFDRQDYINKAQDLFTERDTCGPLMADPTNKLINMLRTIKAEGRLGDTTYKRLHPTGGQAPNSMGCQDPPKGQLL